MDDLSGVVTVEQQINGEWRHLGGLTADMAPGSMSSDPPAGRQIFMFGWWQGVPGVWASKLGVDIELVGGRMMITTEGFDLIADLRDGKCELTKFWNGLEIETRFQLED